MNCMNDVARVKPAKQLCFRVISSLNKWKKKKCTKKGHHIFRVQTQKFLSGVRISPRGQTAALLAAHFYSCPPRVETLSIKQLALCVLWQHRVCRARRKTLVWFHFVSESDRCQASEAQKDPRRAEASHHPAKNAQHANKCHVCIGAEIN